MIKATLIPVVLLMLAGTAMANTAQMVIGSASGESAVGQTISIPVIIDPAGQMVDTARVVLSFDPDAMEALSFSLASPLSMTAPLSHIDNTDGIISWGGFHISDRLTSRGAFGTAKFRLKRAGTTQVALSRDSHVIGAGHDLGTVQPMAATLRVAAVPTSSKISENIDLGAQDMQSDGYHYRIVRTTAFCSMVPHLCDQPWWTALVSLFVLIAVLVAANLLHHKPNSTDETTT